MLRLRALTNYRPRSAKLVTGKSNSWSSNWECTRRKSRRNLRCLPGAIPCTSARGRGEIITLEESNSSAAEERCRLGNEEKEVFNMESARYWRAASAGERSYRSCARQAADLNRDHAIEISRCRLNAAGIAAGELLLSWGL
jgi:hypothetical protein